jgi:hypothetical protein
MKVQVSLGVGLQTSSIFQRVPTQRKVKEATLLVTFFYTDSDS